MKKEIAKIIKEEKEDIQTLKKIIKGEKVTLRISLKDINVLKIIADNWLFTILLIAFLISGFFLGAVSFEQTCNKAILECQDKCNEFLGYDDMFLVPPLHDLEPEIPMSPGITHQEE